MMVIGMARGSEGPQNQRRPPTGSQLAQEQHRMRTQMTGAPQVSDWTQTEAEVAEAAVNTEHNEDSEMTSSDAALPMPS
jgi:hypothetical protein